VQQPQLNYDYDSCKEQSAGEAGLNHSFPKNFQRIVFERLWKSLAKVFGKSLEKSLETTTNSEGICFFGHDMSDAFRALFQPLGIFAVNW
jgi:hypothetical protein